MVTSADGIVSAHDVQVHVPGGASLWRPYRSSAGSSSSLPAETASLGLRFYEWRFERFWLDEGSGAWVRHAFNLSRDYDAVHAIAARRAGDDTPRLLSYGRNEIDIKPLPLWALLASESLSPFSIFQFFAVMVWYSQPYVGFASIILALTFLSIFQAVFDRYRAQARLHALARESSTVSRVRFTESRGVVVDEVSSEELLPGDVVEVGVNPEGTALAFDGLLLTGSVVVNEAMLTGESAPVLKSALPMTPSGTGSDLLRLGSARDSKFTLSAGTRVIQARASCIPPVAIKGLLPGEEPTSVWQHLATSPRPVVLAMVSRTSFGTSKGQLIRAIVFPKPSRFNMAREIYLFFGFLVLTLAVGVAVYVPTTQDPGDPVSASVVIKKILNLVTVIISPALPLSLTIGVSIARDRLARGGISCINPPRIVAAGRVNMLCFDKTGTLTEESLSLRQTLPATDSAVTKEDLDIFLGACHGVASLDAPTPGGEHVIVGDPLEIGMLRAAGWTLSQRPAPQLHDERKDAAQASVWSDIGGVPVPPSTDTIMLPPQAPAQRPSATGLMLGAPVCIVRRLDFDSDLRRMSVVALTRSAGAAPGLALLVKGAPESLRPLCDPRSVPRDFETTLERHTSDGMRVLACAFRPLDVSGLAGILEAPRSELERGLTFAGFLVMVNELKGATVPALMHHAKCGLRQAMVTGDHALTAISVAGKCGPAFISPGARTALIDVAEAGPVALVARIAGPDGLEVDLSSPSLAKAIAGCNLAVTGAAFSALLLEHQAVPAGNRAARRSTTLAALATRVNVWARFSPGNKQELVDVLGELDYVVAFTGDGANDSGALKAADVGISISAAAAAPREKASASGGSGGGDGGGGGGGGAAAATIAAPFSTRMHDITATTTVLMHGRASLVTSFANFKFMFVYGLVQFVTTLLVYLSGTEVGEAQYVWYDLCCALVPLVLIPLLGPAPLSLEKPPSTLLSGAMMRSIFGVVGLIVWPQVAITKLLQAQSWYVRPERFDGFVGVPATDDATALFNVSQYLYLFAGLTAACNYGLFRKPLYSAKLYSAYLLAMWVAMTVFCLAPSPGVNKLFGTTRFDKPYHGAFRVKTWLLGNAGGLFIVIYERFFVPHTASEPPTYEPLATAGYDRIYNVPGASPRMPTEDWSPTVIPPMRVKRGYHEASKEADKRFGRISRGLLVPTSAV